MRRFVNQLFGWNRPETEGEFLFYRLFELAVIYFTIFYAWVWGHYIPQLGSVVLPLGLANYIGVEFMYTEWVAYTNAVLISILVVLGYFRVHRWSYALALLFFHMQYVARFSQGEISHGSNMIGTALMAFAVAAIVFRNPEYMRKFALGTLIFFIGLGYTSAAISKLVASGPLWVDGRHLWMWIAERSTDVYSQHGSFELNHLQELALQHRWVATMILLFGLLTELMGFTFWFRKSRPFIATFLIGMHFGILLTMNISFSKYVYLMILLGYPWPTFLDSLLNRLPTTSTIKKITSDRYKRRKFLLG